MFAAIDDTKIKPLIGRRNIGDDISFLCLSSGATYWYHKSIKTNPISQSNPMKLTELTGEDSGSYFCYSSYSNVDKHFVAKAIMNVYGKN